MATTVLDTPCREWQGGKNDQGYGVLHRDGEQYYVHRWVSTLLDGEIPPGIEVMHRCDNPPCFRYDHLVRGTRQENMADMAAKRRSHQTREDPLPAGS